MNRNVITITPTGDITLDEWAEECPPLGKMQAAVGGLIEHVYLKDGRVMVVNEQGLLRRLPENHSASRMCQRFIVGNALIFCADYIIGDV